MDDQYKWNHIISRIKFEFDTTPETLVPIIVRAASYHREGEKGPGSAKPVWPRTQNQWVGAFTTTELNEIKDNYEFLRGNSDDRDRIDRSHILPSG